MKYILHKALLVGTLSSVVLAPVLTGCGGGSGTKSGNSSGSPLLTAWQTQNSGRYARVVQQTSGAPTAVWPAAGLTNTGGGQTKPAYSDIQQVSRSASFVYIKGTGLASHQMGPWYDSLGAIFGNWPSNQNYIRRFPTTPQPATTKTTNSLGSLGLWVNGVAFYNMLDGAHYDTASGKEVQPAPNAAAATDGIWFRNAVFVEGPTFDKSNAHQPGTGEYHYHSNPAALRFQLGDNISGDSTSGYVEDTSKLHHSPILGYAYDGYPVYGPYGYSNADGTGGVRRMISGFVIRDGSNGTTNLTTDGRHTLAKWAADLHSVAQTLTTSQYGPDVSTKYALGRYVEDFDYLGDHGKVQGKDFDLDVYNGRQCVTPEYPNGTYAYFVTINADGTSAFPYAIGRQWYGVVSGGQVTSISETVTVYKDAGPATAIQTAVTSSGAGKQLTWTSVEGGHYKVEGSNDSSTYTTVVADVVSQGLTTVYNTTGTLYTSYRVTLASLDSYDSTGSAGSGMMPPPGKSRIISRQSVSSSRNSR